MGSIIYDTGALVAAERRAKRMWALHAEILSAGIVPIVPAVVLAQGWRGGPQTELSRLLKGCEIVSDDETMARAAGRACALAETNDIVDAIVVVTAIAQNSLVVTSDKADIARLAKATGTPIGIHAI